MLYHRFSGILGKQDGGVRLRLAGGGQLPGVAADQLLHGDIQQHDAHDENEQLVMKMNHAEKTRLDEKLAEARREEELPVTLMWFGAALILAFAIPVCALIAAGWIAERMNH
jgi:hypothetical protein